MRTVRLTGESAPAATRLTAVHPPSCTAHPHCGGGGGGGGGSSSSHAASSASARSCNRVRNYNDPALPAARAPTAVPSILRATYAPLSFLVHSPLSGRIACQDIACKDIACEDVACDGIVGEDIACKDIACKDVACQDVACYLLRAAELPSKS